ncbi:hypothetical protein [Bacterioplanoides sp.]|uniref:hypothetical protein n=1 Tax=Bacterioplanoides sp. TaxID=2066072 RepID=UPI003B59CCDF
MVTAEWTPISEINLLSLLDQAEQQMQPQIRQVWENVRLPQPELWQQHPWGDEGCGFWVVAVFGRTCVYFNDITSGFCQSAFQDWGYIDNYSQETPKLEQILINQFQKIRA